MAKNLSQSDDISDNVVVKASLVTPLLTCDLCGGLYKEATTVKHCLHVFCRSCLYKDFATSRGSKKCPSKGCATEIPNLEVAVKTDFAIQRLVDKLFPQVVKWDSEEEASFYEQNGFKLKADMPAEEPPKKRGRGRSRNKVEDVESQQKPNEEESGGTVELIGFFLLPLKISNVSYREKYSLSSLCKPFLQSGPLLTMQSLTEYLLKKLNPLADSGNSSTAEFFFHKIHLEWNGETLNPKYQLCEVNKKWQNSSLSEGKNCFMEINYSKQFPPEIDINKTEENE